MRNSEGWKDLSENILKLPLVAVDGKARSTDCANTEVLLRINPVDSQSQGGASEALVWVGLWPHPNILQALSLIRISTPGVPKQPYLQLTYANGGTLRHQLRHHPPKLDVAGE